MIIITGSFVFRNNRIITFVKILDKTILVNWFSESFINFVFQQKVREILFNFYIIQN